MKKVRSELVFDSSLGVELFIEFSLGKNSKVVDAFVIILFCWLGDKKFEVIKYDFSEKENFHVHKNYLSIPRKEYLLDEVNSELLIKIKDEIKKNWMEYVECFKQKHYI